MKKTLQQEAEKWLQNFAPHIELISWGGSSRKKSLFFDRNLQREFKLDFRTVKAKILKNPNIHFGFITKVEVENWLKINFPHIALMKWAGRAYKKSIFIDLKRQVEFEASFRDVQQGLKQNPDRIFAPNKEEFRISCQKGIANRKVNPITTLQTAVEKKYGVENISLHKETVEKRTEKLKKVLKNPKVTNKRKRTNLKKYGAENPLQNERIKEKRKKTCLLKYGVEHHSQNANIIAKVQKTKFINGNLANVSNVSLRDLANKKGCSYSHLSALYRKFGPETTGEYELSLTSIEQQIKSFLKENNIDYEQNKSIIAGKKIRPDFYISKNKLAIECDGLYWHSDAKVDKRYHLKKKQAYNNHNISSLFFREDEILDKFPIVESVIKNKLGLSKRIFARKCKIGSLKSSHDFFAKNHLMGKGQGRIYTLEYDDNVVCAIQVKWKSKAAKLLEVSRFAPETGYSVVGGFSKLISHVITTEQPKKIITFIDLRYGSGAYLPLLGWQLVNADLSFKWCKNQKTVHRMKFPGNTGYQFGYQKIWDCGQAKYEFRIS